MSKDKNERVYAGRKCASIQELRPIDDILFEILAENKDTNQEILKTISL